MSLNYAEDYVLENERARLEPLSVAHYKALSTWVDEKEIWTFFLGRSNGAEDFKAYFEDALRARTLGKEYPFAVFDKEQDVYAGCTRLFDYEESLQIIRLGYTWYGKKFWGSGLNKHCKYLLLEFVFEHLQLERLGLGAHAENERSIQAMKSIGCKEEGVIRNAFPAIKESGRANAVLLGVLKSEWFSTAKQTLKQKL
ncbi:MAG: N-acetyltransferase [Allomuricauda sp.]|nr:MAG: N-acetyltransferase [Allomuricauda sp.]